MKCGFRAGRLKRLLWGHSEDLNVGKVWLFPERKQHRSLSYLESQRSVRGYNDRVSPKATQDFSALVPLTSWTRWRLSWAVLGLVFVQQQFFASSSPQSDDQKCLQMLLNDPGENLTQLREEIVLYT